MLDCTINYFFALTSVALEKTFLLETTYLGRTTEDGARLQPTKENLLAHAASANQTNSAGCVNASVSFHGLKQQEFANYSFQVTHGSSTCIAWPFCSTGQTQTIFICKRANM